MPPSAARAVADEAFAARDRRDVGHEWNRVAVDSGSRGLDRLRVASADRDLHTLGRERLGDPEARAPRGRRHRGSLSAYPEIHGQLPRSNVPCLRTLSPVLPDAVRHPRADLIAGQPAPELPAETSALILRAMHDLVIRGGTVVDGTGGRPVAADVAIDGDRITTVGLVAEPARTEIDARGAYVTPGFVDVHTHLDAQIAWDPDATSSCWHGVTSVVLGNCGVTFAPVRKGQERWLAELMESVEDIPADAHPRRVSRGTGRPTATTSPRSTRCPRA